MKKRIWLITGISSGLGKALFEHVMSQGDFVIGTFRKEAQVEQFNRTHHGNAKAFLLDLADQASIEKSIKQIESEFGRVDVLVNNAGVGFIGAVEETSDSETRRIFESNVFGTLHVTRNVLPMMRSAQCGHIFQISSHGGLKAFAGFGIYNASKFALEGFSEAMAQELSPLGIHTTIVEPGPFRTNFAGSSLSEAVMQISDYDQTAGVFRSKLKGVDGKQEGDPRKAATAIYNTSLEATPPLRLPLGKTALMTIQMKLDSVQADLERSRKVAAEAIF